MKLIICACSPASNSILQAWKSTKDITDRCMDNLKKYTTVYPVHDDVCEEILGTLVSQKTKK